MTTTPPYQQMNETSSTIEVRQKQTNQAIKYQERVNRISQRLNQMQISIENEKYDKLQNLDRHIHNIDQSLNQWQD